MALSLHTKLCDMLGIEYPVMAFTTYARMPRSVNGDEWQSDLRGRRGQPAPFDRPSHEMPRLVGGEFHSYSRRRGSSM